MSKENPMGTKNGADLDRGTSTVVTVPFDLDTGVANFKGATKVEICNDKRTNDDISCDIKPKKRKKFSSREDDRVELEGPLFGSDEYQKSLEEFDRIDASLSQTLREWSTIPFLEKCRIVENEYSRKLLKLSREDMQRFGMLLKKRKARYIREETELLHLLLEKFFCKLNQVAMIDQFQADHNMAMNKDGRNLKTADHLKADMEMNDVLLMLSQEKVSADYDYRKYFIHDQTFSLSEFIEIGKAFDERFKDINQAYRDVLYRFKHNKNVCEYSSSDILDIFGPRLMRICKPKKMKKLFCINASHDRHFNPPYSTTAFNSDSTVFAALCEKGCTFVEYDHFYLHNPDTSNGSVLNNEKSRINTTLVWNPTRRDQLCVAVFEQKLSVGGLNFVDAEVARSTSYFRVRPDLITGLDWECTGTKLGLIRDGTSEVSFWSPTTNESLGTMNVVRHLVPTCIKFSPFKQDFLAVGYEEGIITLHDNRNLRRPWLYSKLFNSKGPVTGINFLSGNELLVTSLNGHPTLLQINDTMSTPVQKFKFTDSGSPAYYPAALASHNDYFAVMGSDGGVRVYNRFSSKRLASFDDLLGKEFRHYRHVAGCLDWHKSPHSNMLVINFHRKICAIQVD